jgi:hypothetical protein
MSINRRKLLRGLEYRMKDQEGASSDAFLDLINQIERGKYDEGWSNRIVSSLFFIFLGMVLGLIFLGVLLQL